MRRPWVVAVIALCVVAIASQLVIPVLGERSLTDRLTEEGGEASAELRSFPALRLLWGSGERIAISGSGLELDDPDTGLEELEELDGFGEVAIELERSKVGPIEARTLELTREGEAPYRLYVDGGFSAAEAIATGARELGLPGAGLAPYVAGLVPELLDPEVPIELDVELLSHDGGVEVLGGEGRVGGIPAGALAELIARAIAEQL